MCTVFSPANDRNIYLYDKRFCTGMKTGAPRACVTGKNPTHCEIFVLWKPLWHSRVVTLEGGRGDIRGGLGSRDSVEMDGWGRGTPGRGGSGGIQGGRRGGIY